MSGGHADRGTAAANAAIEALGANRRDKAARLFDEALGHFEQIDDDAQRRDELGPFALLADRCGFPDLALMAAQLAVALDESLGDDRARGEDLVTCGNAHLHMGNDAEALGAYRQALRLFLDIGAYGNAASASTNIALIVGNGGDMDEAIRMMYESLDYLGREPHPATEIITRIALTQALEVEGRRPEDVFAVARPVTRHAAELRPDQWDGLRGPLSQTVDRYVAAHPGEDAGAVKRAHLPGIFG